MNKTIPFASIAIAIAIAALLKPQVPHYFQHRMWFSAPERQQRHLVMIMMTMMTIRTIRSLRNVRNTTTRMISTKSARNFRDQQNMECVKRSE